MRKLTRWQTTWIAGFLEGEGSFVISYQAKKLSDGRSNFRMRISTGQKDPIPLNYILKTTGIGYLNYKEKSREIGSFSYHHQINKRQDIIDFIKAIYPYIKSPRTRKRAWCVYRMANLINCNGSNERITDDNHKSRIKIYEIWKTTRRPRRTKSKVK